MNWRQGGFTLLEMLVALVVVGFIVVGLTTGMRFGLRAWETQSRLIGHREDMDAVDRSLRRLIEAIDPGTLADPLPFRGSNSSLAFTSEMPVGSGLALRRTDLRLDLDTAHRLVLRWTPHLHAARLGPAPTPQTSELLGGVDHVELSYWGQTGTWQNQWTQTGLPRLIRIRLIFSKNEPRRWPDIVAAPMRTPLQAGTEPNN